jgi:signal transduction histidine kinase
VRSLRALNGLLLLFVLVPAGVLGWLGLKAADGYEAEMAGYLRRELDTAGLLVVRIAQEAVEEEGRDAKERLAAAATYVESRLPFDKPLAVLSGAKRVLATAGLPRLHALWREDRLEVAVAAASGVQLVPLELKDEPAPATSDRDRLLEDLRRDADVALFGRGDPAAAAAVWAGAAERAPDEAFRARVAVEALWTSVRAGRAPSVVQPSVARLLETWPEPLLAAAGRTWVRLLLLAADRPALERLSASGRLAETALTREERAKADGLLRASKASAAGPRMELVSPLPQGLSLRVVRTGPTAAALLETLADGPISRALRDLGPITLEAGRPTPPPHLASGRVGPPEIPSTLGIEVPRPMGEPLAITLRHGGAASLERDVARRKAWAAVAVGAMLAVVLLGLLLTRRAVAREREAVRLRDEFLANVSHELRTPLTSVSLHAELLARPELSPEKRREHVEVVQAESARLSALVEDLLDFSALERGARRLEPEPVDLGAAVARSLAPYRVLAERQGVRLAAPPAPRTIEALVDGQALARILANLLANAFKHGTPARDGGTPTVRVLVQGGAGRTEVEVRDNGPGIPRDERVRLFERFQRGRAAGRRPGTGLGLSLSRSLARAMGGDLAYVEDPGETVFRLTLPSAPAILGAGDEVEA